MAPLSSAHVEWRIKLRFSFCTAEKAVVGGVSVVAAVGSCRASGSVVENGGGLGGDDAM